MGITHLPQQVASTVEESADTLKRQSNRLLNGAWEQKHWVRTVAAGSLITSAVLLVTGKRKAALAVAAAGTAFALAEDPAGVKKAWNNLPDYLESGHGLLTRFEHFVGELSSQGEKLRAVIEKTTRS